MAILICSILVLIFSILFLKIIIRKDVGHNLLGILGASLVAFVTGNTISTIIPLNEHLCRNNGIKPSVAKILTPIGAVFNRTGTVIVSSIVIMTILCSYHLNSISFSLQMLIFLAVFFFSLKLAGANDMGFLVLTAMVLQFNPLKLEENSYLLFLLFLPLLNRLAVFFDVVTTGIFIIISSKISDKITKKEYIDFI